MKPPLRGATSFPGPLGQLRTRGSESLTLARLAAELPIGRTVTPVMLIRKLGFRRVRVSPLVPRPLGRNEPTPTSVIRCASSYDL